MDFILLAYDLICSHLYSSEFGFFSVVAFNNLKNQYKPINSKNSKIDSIQDEKEEVELTKSNILLLGPTGSGKTRTAMNLISKHLNRRDEGLVLG